MSSPWAGRRRRIRKWLEQQGADAFLVSSSHNVHYLFGFRGEGLGVVAECPALCADRRYELDAAALPGRLRRVLHPGGHLAGVIEHLKAVGARKVAFESQVLTFATFEQLRKKLRGIKLVPTTTVIEGFRAVKSADEIALMARAAEVTDQALAAIAPLLVPGVTEREIALELDRQMLVHGAERPAFDTIVAFGPSAASPHAVPGERVLEAGHMVKIDCGAQVDGYCSDITRTTPIGTPDTRFERVYGAVLEAQQAAVAAARAGVCGRDLDAVARDILRDRGLAEQFGHGLGHGVGLEIHELPRVSSRSEDVLQRGMVVTIEPGVYIEDWGGVRIEDTVVIEPRGCKVLTHAPKWGLSGA
jgi:Xaa-Pro aminopeptidase